MQKIAISKIKPNEANPRKIDVLQLERLKKSIQDFPEMLDLRPIVINKDNVVLGGNMRLKALQDLGYTEVSFLYAENLTPEQEKEFIIKDNVGFGEWDWDVLQSEWTEEPLQEWGLDLPTFESESEPIETAGDDDLPEEPKKVFVVRGDIFEIKANGVKIRVGCLDSTNVSDIEKLMQGEKSDMIFTDPPYDIENNLLYANIIKEFSYNAHIFVMHDDRGIVDYLKNSCLDFLRFFVADFTFSSPRGNDPYLRHILISQEKNGDAIKHQNMFDGFGSIIKMEYRGFLKDEKTEHKHQKSITFIEKFLTHYSEVNKNVLDVFCGSGSTAIACLKNKRNCFTNDISENYVQIAVKRIIEFCKTNNFEYTITLNDLEFDVNRLYE